MATASSEAVLISHCKLMSLNFFWSISKVLEGHAKAPEAAARWSPHDNYCREVSPSTHPDWQLVPGTHYPRKTKITVTARQYR